jgi:hypothetical protein
MRGGIVEIGCWQGKSTIALARACYPEPVHAVDHWLGNLDEHSADESVIIARQRDVFKEFMENMRNCTEGNVVPWRMDWREFVKLWTKRVDSSIKFCHIDASHDYKSVRDNIQAILPFIVPGGILCGDDFQTSNLSRHDLDGGVERAVRESLPGFYNHGNLWYWYRGVRAHKLLSITSRLRKTRSRCLA